MPGDLSGHPAVSGTGVSEPLPGRESRPGRSLDLFVSEDEREAASRSSTEELKP